MACKHRGAKIQRQSQQTDEYRKNFNKLRIGKREKKRPSVVHIVKVCAYLREYCSKSVDASFLKPNQDRKFEKRKACSALSHLIECTAGRRRHS